MSISRDTLIAVLHENLAADPAILALWLEGADATGLVDPYSDIDLCCAVEAGAMDAVTAHAQQILAGLGTIDLIERATRQKDFQFTTFHLADTSPYLLIDFNVFVGRGSQFTAGDAIEQPLILFDRGGVIRFAQTDEQQLRAHRTQRLQALSAIAAQDARIEKYILRGEFLEAFGYYHKWLLTPLIEVLRLRYTPLHSDYFIVHISRHLPVEVLRRLEDLFKVNSLEELAIKSRAARSLFEETAAFLRSPDL
jgi:hypothetical protein